MGHKEGAQTRCEQKVKAVQRGVLATTFTRLICARSLPPILAIPRFYFTSYSALTLGRAWPLKSPVRKRLWWREGMAGPVRGCTEASV